MKVIDLLNKIANREEVPKKIKYGNYILTYDEDTQDYYNEPSCTYALLGNLHYKLNDKVEIIEDISNLKWGEYVIKQDVKKCSEKDLRTYISLLMETQNEIIDRLKGEDNE